MKLLFTTTLALSVILFSGCEKNESVVPVSVGSFQVEKVPVSIGEKIKENLSEFTQMTEYPDGFQSVDDVKLDWISIAGLHTRAAVYEDLFLFPYWNTSIEREGWETGLAFRKDSPIVYSWKLED